MRALAARFDDWINPIAIKELRQAVRGKFVMVALILSLAAQLITVTVLTISNALSGNDTTAGPVAFTVIFSVVFVAAIFFVPMYSGFRMAAERSDANVDLLFITTIRPRTIVLGKVLAVMGIVVLIFSASLPFLIFSYVLRGVDFIAIGWLLLGAVFAVISHSIVALFIGALPASRPFKILLALGFFLSTFGVIAPFIAGTTALMQSGWSMGAKPPQFWAGVAALAVSMIGFDSVLLVLTTAMITPAAANRALPIRLMLLITWALSYGGALWMAVANTNALEVLLIWAVAQLALITLVLLSATSEREAWGARVARTIPRDPLRRGLAFLFYSGAAGGTLWAVAMYAATIGLYYGGLTLADTRMKTDAMLMVNYLTDGALTMLAYAMTAVLLRRTVFKRFPANRTWGLALILFIVLTAIPPLAILSRDAESLDWSVYVHITTIANPFPTAQRPAEWRLARTIFLAVWAGLATAANGAWFAAQMARFKPLAPRPRDPESPDALAELAAE